MSFLFSGGSSESNLIIPEGEKPKAFQTVIPKKSYKDLYRIYQTYLDKNDNPSEQQLRD